MLSNIQKSHILINEQGIDFYTVKGLNDVHQEMLKLLSIIDDIAESNNIKYWIDGGSLIGTVRHNGFIPWDDDFDISLLKEDYLKLITALDDFCKKNKDVYLFYSSPQRYHTCNFFASTRIYTRTEGSPMLVPVKVDIRPLNCINNNERDIQENFILRDVANWIIFKKKYGYATDAQIKSLVSFDGASKP